MVANAILSLMTKVNRGVLRVQVALHIDNVCSYCQSIRYTVLEVETLVHSEASLGSRV